MSMERLAGVVSKLQRRFPAENYGWAKLLGNGNVNRKGKRLIALRPSGAQSFDCYTSALAAKKALERELFVRAQVLQIEVPIRGEELVFRHYLAAFEWGKEEVVVGLTPLDRLVGLYPFKVLSAYEYAELQDVYRSTPSNCPRELAQVVIDGSPLPLRTEQNGNGRGELDIAEISLSSNVLSRKFTLGTHTFSFDAATHEIVPLASVTFTYSFLRRLAGAAPLPDRVAQGEVKTSGRKPALFALAGEVFPVMRRVMALALSRQ